MSAWRHELDGWQVVLPSAHRAKMPLATRATGVGVPGIVDAPGSSLQHLAKPTNRSGTRDESDERTAEHDYPPLCRMGEFDFRHRRLNLAA